MSVDPSTQPSIDRIKALSDEAIQDCIAFDKKGNFDFNNHWFVRLRDTTFPLDINLSWIACQLAKELYARGLYTEHQLRFITGE